jgi:hypothetical protein
MPTIKRFETCAIKLYADDHNPPHFHIVSHNFQVLVRLSDFTVMAGDATKKQMAEALAWAITNKAYLMSMWTELNERN